MWFWYALSSAVFGGVVIVLNKKLLRVVNVSIMAWVLAVVPIPFLLPLVLFTGIGSISHLFFFGIFGSACFFFLAKMLQLASIKASVLSQVVPLSAFFALFTYLLGLVFLSESLTFQSVLGLLLIVVGAYLLNFDKLKKGLLKPIFLLFQNRGSRLYLLATFLGAITAIFDKIGLLGVKPFNSALVYLGESIVLSTILTGYIFIKKFDLVGAVSKNLKLLFTAGFLYSLTVLSVFQGFGDGPVALVIGVKQLQTVLVLVMSMFLYNDRPTKHAWMATLIMIFGVILIKLA